MIEACLTADVVSALIAREYLSSHRVSPLRVAAWECETASAKSTLPLTLCKQAAAVKYTIRLLQHLRAVRIAS